MLPARAAWCSALRPPSPRAYGCALSRASLVPPAGGRRPCGALAPGPARWARLRLASPAAYATPAGARAGLRRDPFLATCPRPHPDRHAAPVRLRPPLLVALAAAVRLMVAHRPNGLARLRCACAPGGRSGRLPCGTPPGAASPLVTLTPPPVATLCARPPLASEYPIRPARQGYAPPFGP